jgi:hypothetical protein
LFVGLAATTTPREPALGEGVVAIGGWDVHAMRSTEASAEMLYLRSV